MRIHFHKNFWNNFGIRISLNKNLVRRFHQRLELFIQDSEDPLLYDHALQRGKPHRRSFSVTDDVRVIYEKTRDTITLVDIGTHDQIY